MATINSFLETITTLSVLCHHTFTPSGRIPLSEVAYGNSGVIPNTGDCGDSDFAPNFIPADKHRSCLAYQFVFGERPRIKLSGQLAY